MSSAHHAGIYEGCSCVPVLWGRLCQAMSMSPTARPALEILMPVTLWRQCGRNPSMSILLSTVRLEWAVHLVTTAVDSAVKL